MPLAFISHPDCALPQLGDQHPESQQRLSAIEDQLLASGLEFTLRRYDAPSATREQLCRAHAASCVEHIFSAAPTEGLVWLDQSTSMAPHSLNAALSAAGAVVIGVDLVMSCQTRAAFYYVRPPGHHAEHDHAASSTMLQSARLTPCMLTHPSAWRSWISMRIMVTAPNPFSETIPGFFIAPPSSTPVTRTAISKRLMQTSSMFPSRRRPRERGSVSPWNPAGYPGWSSFARS